MGWETCCCARSLACAAIGCAASTKRSGDSGLPWKTPESTGKASVCQPLKATRAVVPECKRCIQRCAPGPRPTCTARSRPCRDGRRPSRSPGIQGRLADGWPPSSRSPQTWHVVPNPALREEACLGGVSNLVEQRADAAGDRLRCQLFFFFFLRGSPRYYIGANRTLPSTHAIGYVGKPVRVGARRALPQEDNAIMR